MPRLSVILPAHNARRYIRAAVDSILAQTFQDFELIIIDDGSTDGTTEILRAYAATQSRVRLISRPNTGYTRALLEAMSLATAPLIARMDADDIAMPDRFGKQVAAFDADDGLVLLGAAYEFIDEADRPIKRWPQPLDHATLDASALAGGNPFCHPVVMFRRDAYDKAGGYNIAFEPAEDLDLWLKLAEIGRVATLPDMLLLYRQHAKSVSRVRQKKQVDRIQAACAAGRRRRGLPAVPDVEPSRPSDEGRAARFATTTTFGWWALGDGHRRTAAVYGVKSIALMPWRAEGWAMLAKALRG